MITDLYQYLPNEGGLPDHPMEVVFCMTTRPFILELYYLIRIPLHFKRIQGARDAEKINADYFKVSIDLYILAGCLHFRTLVLGVQFDNKISDDTHTMRYGECYKIYPQGLGGTIIIYLGDPIS